MALFTQQSHHARTPRMEKLSVICRGGAHPIPTRMVYISRVRHPRYGALWIYACPFGRGTPHACRMRAGWIVGYNGRPFELFRGQHNGHFH